MLDALIQAWETLVEILGFRRGFTTRLIVVWLAGLTAIILVVWWLWPIEFLR